MMAEFLQRLVERAGGAPGVLRPLISSAYTSGPEVVMDPQPDSLPEILDTADATAPAARREAPKRDGRDSLKSAPPFDTMPSHPAPIPEAAKPGAGDEESGEREAGNRSRKLVQPIREAGSVDEGRAPKQPAQLDETSFPVSGRRAASSQDRPVDPFPGAPQPTPAREREVARTLVTPVSRSGIAAAVPERPERSDPPAIAGDPQAQHARTSPRYESEVEERSNIRPNIVVSTRQASAETQEQARGPMDAGQAPIIKVTIGRVEVRAVFPPAKPQARAVAAKPAQLTLEEYLKKGNGGAR